MVFNLCQQRWRKFSGCCAHSALLTGGASESEVREENFSEQMFATVQRSPVSRIGSGVCVADVFRTRQWLSPVGADCMRQAPRMGEMVPANLSGFIICWSWARKMLNICLSSFQLVRSCLQSPSPAGCLYNPTSKNNILRKHIIYFEFCKGISLFLSLFFAQILIISTLQ